MIGSLVRYISQMILGVVNFYYYYIVYFNYMRSLYCDIVKAIIILKNLRYMHLVLKFSKHTTI